MYTYMVYFLKILSHLLNYFFDFSGRSSFFLKNLERIKRKEKGLSFFKYLYFLNFYLVKLFDLYHFVPCNLSKVFILELEMMYFFQYFFQMIRLFLKKYLEEVFLVLKDNLSLNASFLEREILFRGKNFQRGNLFFNCFHREFLQGFEKGKEFFFRRNFLYFLEYIKNFDKNLLSILDLDIKSDVNYLYTRHYSELKKHFFFGSICY